jgi:hypothetical protein
MHTEQVNKTTVLWFDSIRISGIKRTPEGGVVGFVDASGAMRDTATWEAVKAVSVGDSVTGFADGVGAVLGRSGAEVVDAIAAYLEARYTVPPAVVEPLPFDSTPYVPPVVEPPAIVVQPNEPEPT